MAQGDYAYMPLDDYTAACDAIRAKKGLSSSTKIKSGDMAQQITSIAVGTDVSGTTATAAKVQQGATFYDASGTLTYGSMPEVGATTYYATSSTQDIITAGKRTAGVQKIAAVTTSNLSAGNIKAGVVVKVGDASTPDRIKSVTGTYAVASETTVSGTFTGSNSSSASATASGVSSSKTIIAWGVSGSGNQDSFYRADGHGGGSGTAIYTRVLESTGWTITTGPATCSLGSNSVSFSTGNSSYPFANGVSYSWWVIYK